MRDRSVFVFESIDPTGQSLDWLRAEGFRVTEGIRMWEPPYRRYSPREVVELAQGHGALMGASGVRVDEDLMRQLPDLEVISKFGVGVDTIDLTAASRHHVTVMNSPAPEDFEAVAEHTIAVMLMLKKKLWHFNSQYVKDGGWRNGPVWAEHIEHSTIGLIGFGRIGRGVARRLAGWGAEVLAVDPAVSDGEGLAAMVSLEDLLERSDVVSLHATVQGKVILGADEFARMKRGAVLINTARGSLIDSDALHASLAEGHIGGASIDVFETEPPPPHALFDLPNCIATPHIGAWTRASAGGLGWRAARNLAAFADGHTPDDVCVDGRPPQARKDTDT